MLENVQFDNTTGTISATSALGNVTTLPLGYKQQKAEEIQGIPKIYIIEDENMLPFINSANVDTLAKIASTGKTFRATGTEWVVIFEGTSVATQPPASNVLSFPTFYKDVSYPPQSIVMYDGNIYATLNGANPSVTPIGNLSWDRLRIGDLFLTYPNTTINGDNVGIKTVISVINDSISTNKVLASQKVRLLNYGDCWYSAGNLGIDGVVSKHMDNSINNIWELDYEVLHASGILDFAIDADGNTYVLRSGLIQKYAGLSVTLLEEWVVSTTTASIYIYQGLLYTSTNNAIVTKYTSLAPLTVADTLVLTSPLLATDTNRNIVITDGNLLLVSGNGRIIVKYKGFTSQIDDMMVTPTTSNYTVCLKNNVYYSLTTASNTEFCTMSKSKGF